MKRNNSGNVTTVAYTRPPTRLAQTVGHARPSDVLRFASGQRGISSYKVSVETAEEEV